ncbi:MAG: glycerol-3-phosphate dehydrogenase/oxidase [Rhodanobacter sp.]|nr:glycerol-3-phosphate dehydrogenase/oxidase [Rhodanobacter sp.]
MSADVWDAAWRTRALPELAARHWDLIVIGGGISGAGILQAAAQRGWTCLLLEQRDFAWGTSSRSSKMVHGGLRYIATGQFGLTRDAVRERQRLLTEAPGLVDRLGFLMPHYRGRFPGPVAFGGLLTLYDALAGRRDHRYYPRQQLSCLAPNLKGDDLIGATHFSDAVTDDARLVLRVLGEARAEGGQALNGIKVTALRRKDGRVVGLEAQDRESGQRHTFHARAVAQATGAWSDRLRQHEGPARIRPLRGSHLLLPRWRLPVAQAVSFMHAEDRRLVFVFPWEGATVVGTTDLDHHESLDQEARITVEETAYLLAACAQQFPDAHIGIWDVLSTWAGVRPVISKGKPGTKPSDETREHALWIEPGCVTLAGGKLTTFHLLALDVLKACARFVDRTVHGQDAPVFRAFPLPPMPTLSCALQRRLVGRHGRSLPQLLAVMAQVGSERVADTDTLWAELAWAAQGEMVLHLDDLLLRRTRLGLLLADGGLAQLPRMRALCQSRLGWDDVRWAREEHDYLTLWQNCHGVPGMSHVARHGDASSRAGGGHVNQLKEGAP